MQQENYNTRTTMPVCRAEPCADTYADRRAVVRADDDAELGAVLRADSRAVVGAERFAEKMAQMQINLQIRCRNEAVNVARMLQFNYNCIEIVQ